MKYFFKVLFIFSLIVLSHNLTYAQTATTSEAIGYGYYEGSKVQSIYNGGAALSFTALQNLPKTATVVIPRTAENKTLVLSGYRPIVWTILNPYNVKVKQIIATGYYKQTVVNPGTIPVAYYSSLDGTGYRFAYSNSGASFSGLTYWLQTMNVTLKSENFSAANKAPDSTRLIYGVNGFSAPGTTQTLVSGQSTKLSYMYSADVSSKETYQVVYALKQMTGVTVVSEKTGVLVSGVDSGEMLLNIGTVPQGIYELSATLNVCALSGCSTSTRVVATSTPVMISIVSGATTSVVTASVINPQTVVSTTIQTPKLPSNIGGYFWGGFQTTTRTNDLKQGVIELQKYGFKNMVRVVLQPRVKNSGADDIYGFGKNLALACPNGKPFLPCAVKSSYYKDMLALPELSTIVLTTYDSASNGDNGYGTDFTNPDVLAQVAKQDAVRNEYKEMTLALYRQFAGTNKTFIISNWETDNTIYCGEAYSYVTSSTFKTSCDSQTLTPSKRIAGLTQWFKLRKEGVSLGKAAAQAEGLSGVAVFDAVEFSSMNLLQAKKYSSTLASIIPVVKPSYATYSAWDSVEGGTAERDFNLAKQTLDGYGTKFIIGELGFRDMTTSLSQQWKFRETVKTALRLGIPAIIWEAYPGTGLPDYLVGSNGTEEKILSSLRDELLRYNPSPASTYAVKAVVDRGATSDNKHFFELYGSYGAASSSAFASCDGQSYQSTITYSGTNQINLSLLDVPSAAWCTFTVVNTTNGVKLEYGPVKLCTGTLGGALTCPNPLSLQGDETHSILAGQYTTDQAGLDQNKNPNVLGASTVCVRLSKNLHRGNESSEVTNLQDYLVKIGFLTVNPTGFYGDKTVVAVKRFQESKNLPQTGMVYDFTRSVITYDTCGE